MGKSFKKLKGYLEATWTKLDKNLGSASRRRTWKITEAPVSDMKQTAAEGTLAQAYAPDDSLTKSKERVDNDHKKKEEATSDWRAELLKFKAEAEEFNIELEKAMTRRRQQISYL